MLAPFRFRPVADRLLLTNETGEHGFFDDGVLERLFNDSLDIEERQRLRDLSILIEVPVVRDFWTAGDQI